jgi:hypothetical protein
LWPSYKYHRISSSIRTLASYMHILNIGLHRAPTILICCIHSCLIVYTWHYVVFNFCTHLMYGGKQGGWPIPPYTHICMSNTVTISHLFILHTIPLYLLLSRQRSVERMLATNQRTHTFMMFFTLNFMLTLYMNHTIFLYIGT